MLDDYYGMIVPIEAIESAMANDEEILEILKNDAVRDTMDREYILDKLMQWMNMRTWPMYGDGGDAMKQFVVELRIALHTIGGKFSNEDN